MIFSKESKVATPEQRAQQRDIIEQLYVSPTFDAGSEIERRSEFLANHLQSAGLRTLVLGISGGVDSLVGGLLAQRAAALCRARGYEAAFIAMRLPYGEQADESDAQLSLQVIQPDETLMVDVKPASDSILEQCLAAGLEFRDAGHRDFVHGNIKARQRMVAQFAVAGARQGLVVGTDHAAEALMGFFTKFGDGAADVMPLTGLNKRRVRRLAEFMGAPPEQVYKVPTADLESLSPLQPDELALGVSYDEIDDFLEGKVVSDSAYEVIFSTFRRTAHKRAMPAFPVVA